MPPSQTRWINRYPSPDYVVLITKTLTFDLERDLQLTFCLKSKSLTWFVDVFRKLRVHVVYFILFTGRERRLCGPITTHVSELICKRRLEKRYDPRTTRLVGPAYLKHKIKGFDIVSTPDFLTQILHGEGGSGRN